MVTALQVLDVDVQLMILDALSRTSPRSMLNVALSSRSLYHLSKSFIYHVIHFTFNRSRRDINGRLIKHILDDDDLSAKVQEIRVLWAPSAKLQPGEGSKEDLELLGQALPKLTGLKAFIWDAQYPILSWLLEKLQTHHPQCSLYTRHPMSQDSAQTLPRLCASSCLASLDVTINTGQFQAFRALQKVIESAPNLRDLSIASAFNGPHVSPYQEIGTPNPLHLRSLELYDRNFDICKFPVEWSTLERLSSDSQYFLPDFVPDFAGLKSLKLQTDYSPYVVPLIEALQNCKKLESLDLTGFIEIIDVHVAGDPFWENLGKTLTKLRLHEEEKTISAGSRPTLSIADMGRLAKYCHNLRSLGLDLPCNGQEWPQMMLGRIAHCFWFLVHLELDILIENPQHDHPTSPKATLGSVPKVWRDLWQQIQSFRVREGHSITTPRLRSLDLTAGSKTANPDPMLRLWQVDKQRFTFDISDRDDEARLGIVEVKCTELEALLSKLSSAGPLWTHQQELIMKVANERARKGPHIQMPSVMDSEMVRPSPFWDRLDEERFYYR